MKLTDEQIEKLIEDFNDADGIDLVVFARAIEAAASAPAIADTAKPLTDAQIEAGWRQTFSTDNPFCPCNLKSFTKAVRWAEHAKERK